MNCIFCDAEIGDGLKDGEHHIIPKQMRKILNLDNLLWIKLYEYRVPVCGRHHDILTELMKPLVMIIKELKGVHPAELERLAEQAISNIERIKGSSYQKR